MCGDGYHLGDGPGKPRIKNYYGSHYGTPMGLGEGPGKPRTKNHYGTPRKQHKRTSGKITENSLETDKTMKRDQDATKGLTIQVNNTVTTQAEKLEEPDGQARKMDSLKESQNNNRPRLSETVSTLSNWSLGFMLATICFIATMDVVMISSPLDKQEILHARVRERQHPTRHITYYRSYYNQALRKRTERIQESGIHRPQMTEKGVRFGPETSLQKAPELEGGSLEEMGQATTLSQIEKPKESRGTE